MYSESESEVQDRWDKRIDLVLHKYVSVWIWSIVFGATTGISVTFISFQFIGNLRELSQLLIPILAFGGVFALLAWYFLLRYLVVFIIPVFFYRYKQEDHFETYARGGKLLRWSVLCLTVSFAAGLMVIIFRLVFSALRF